MIDGDRIVHEARYRNPVLAVWQVLTDPSALASWLMPNDFVPTVGHRFRLDARPDFGFIDGEVIEIEPPSLLRCRWTVEGVPSTSGPQPGTRSGGGPVGGRPLPVSRSGDAVMTRSP